jgi:hypothetical protein
MNNSNNSNISDMNQDSGVHNRIANYNSYNIFVSHDPKWKYFAYSHDQIVSFGDKRSNQYFDIIGYYHDMDTLDDTLFNQFYIVSS